MTMFMHCQYPVIMSWGCEEKDHYHHIIQLIEVGNVEQLHWKYLGVLENVPILDHNRHLLASISQGVVHSEKISLTNYRDINMLYNVPQFNKMLMII